MTYNRFDELEAIAEALAGLSSRMEGALSHLPYSLVAEYIQDTRGIADDIANEVRGLRAEVAQAADTAIAALEPAAELFEDEKVEAREQLETDHALPPSADDVVTDLQGDTVEEMREAFEDVFETQAEPVEHISILTGDPAIEPESGLHGDPVPPTEGYAPVVDQPPTNPEADAIAKAHDYYSPEKIAARNRSMFSIFRRESEDA